MFCTKCGNNVPEGNAFCPTCGAPMNAQQQTHQAQQPFTPMAPAPTGVPGNGLAIASMVLGIVSILTFCIWWLCLILGVLAIAFAAIGIYKAKMVGAKSPLAVTGLVCGCIGIGLMLIIYLLTYLTVLDFLTAW